MQKDLQSATLERFTRKYCAKAVYMPELMLKLNCSVRVFSAISMYVDNAIESNQIKLMNKS